MLMRKLLLVAAGCLLLSLSWPLAFYLATSSHGPLWMLSIAQMSVMGAAILAIPTTAVCLVMLFFRRVRRCAALVLAACLFLLASMPLAGRALMALRDSRFHEFASRAQPVVDAVHAFEAANGRAPKALSELVPAKLSRSPTTGMGAFPDFDYSDGSVPYDGGRWRLMVSTSAGPLDWQYLEYRPSQEYPAAIRRYGKWALIVD